MRKSMNRALMPIVILSAISAFTIGVYCSAVRHLPINPDVQATLIQLKYGMDIDDALAIAKMSFVLKEKFVIDKKQMPKSFGQEPDIAKAIKGNVPALAISYDLWLGFSRDGKLLALNYYPVHGFAWFFYPELKAHLFQPLSDSGFNAMRVGGDGVYTNVLIEVIGGTKELDVDRWSGLKSEDPMGVLPALKNRM